MKKLKIILIVMFSLLIPLSTALAFTIPDRPENGFYDPDNYISIETKNKLVEFNEKHKATDHTQLGIAIVNNLEGNDIEDISRKIATSWQIGYENSNRGALLLISINDHKFRIETSNEMRRILTDNEALEILNSIKNEMKNHNYDAAVQSIISKIDNEITKEVNSSNTESDITPMMIFGPMFGVAALMGIADFMRNRRLKREELEFEEQCKLRSQFNYTGNDKLYPEDNHFVEGYWTNEQRNEYLKEKRKKEKEDYKRRSAFTYTGKDKLTPDDKNFDESTWTQDQMMMYYAVLSANKSSHSYSSSNDSSSWSSDSWSGDSGGGFDGGGASGGW